MMDLHAHLLNTEVIGFLAGSWDSEKGVLLIDSALPCRCLEREEGMSDPHINVELSPESEVETRSLIEERNLRIVGWVSKVFFVFFESHINLFQLDQFNSIIAILRLRPIRQ